MQIDPVFSELVGLIYEGPLEETPWQAFLEQCRVSMGASVATLILRSPTTPGLGLMRTVGGVPENIAVYNARSYALDPFVNLPDRQVVWLYEFMDREAVEASDFYQLVLAPSGLHDIIGADFRIPGEVEARFRICRPKGARQFDQSDREACAALLPHIERAIRLHLKLNQVASERSVYAGAIDQMRVATFILDETGRVLSTNLRARELLDRRDGLSLRDDGQLLLGQRELTRELQERVARVIAKQHTDGPSLVEAMRVPRPGGRELGLVIRPVPVTQWAEAETVPAAAIFISDPQEQAEAPVQVVKQLFGFTPAEASLALLLANGLTLDEAAAEMGVSRNTVRTHLRSVFAKTGVTRQPMLVSLILKSVASLG